MTTKKQKPISPALLKKMMTQATAARKRAYAPYSGYHVGVALITDQGRIFAGANCETSNYKSNCAERSAITAMTSAGERRIAALVVSGPEANPITPCGSCRQDIREFARLDTPVYCFSRDGKKAKMFTLAELLPDSFGPENVATVRKKK